ncbi:hypothetical protein H9P43_000531 [Blastocladiella emersonii ATCC 22665]|nr:hypothetical protein H9P43_000531 [Blastocladiella emersonii ATCC 22665]
MRNATEKRVVRTPCPQCPPGNTTCTATCCPVFSTTADHYCTCPIDRLGLDCELYRPFTCTLTSVSPDLSCTSLRAPFPRSAATAASTACGPPLSALSPTTLTFRLSCAFTSRPNLNLTTYPSRNPRAGPVAGPANVTSWLRRDDTFAISAGNPYTVLTTRVANMYRLSDTGATQSSWLARGELAGVDDVAVPLDLPRIVAANVSLSSNGVRVVKPAYVVGGRVYVEAVLASPIAGMAATGSATGVYAFLDLVDLPAWPRGVAAATGMLRTGRGESLVSGVVVLVLLGVVAGIGFLCLIRRAARSPKKVE